MTKKKAFALAKYLDTHCDEAYMFVAKIGSGCLCDVTFKGDGHALLSMLFTLLDRTFKNLKAREQPEFYRLIMEALKTYADDEFKPLDREENLSDKQRRKRMKSNEKILADIEAIL